MSIATISQRLLWNVLSRWLVSQERQAPPLEVNTSGTRVAVWGAGAKGATFCNVVDPDCKFIAFVVDITPAKQGKYIPGTGHPIYAPEALRRVDTVLLMNPNYHEENQRLLEELGIATRIVDV